MHTRSAILLAVALSLPGSAGVAQMSRATLVKQSDIIFIGTVTRVGAVAVPEVPASPRTVVVRVDQVLERAAMVVAGRVEQVRPAELARAPARPKRISEHDPDWQEAIIQVEDGIKGAQAGERVVVRFPGSPDVAWVGTPKFAVGQEGTFLLHKDSTTGSPLTMIAGRSVPAYTALHKVDVLSKQDATRVRALIRKP